jgi:hypothetical protein
MKIYFTKTELLEEWEEKHPSDPDKEHNAIAGHVETKKGFIWYSYWATQRSSYEYNIQT